MSDTLHVKFNFDLDRYLKSSEIVYNHELKHSPKRFLGWFFIALSQFGVVITLRNGTIGLLSISTILVIYWYGFRWKIREFFIKKSFKNHPYANKTIDISLENHNLYINKHQIEEKYIDGIVSLDEGIILYINKNGLFIPSSAFQSTEEKNSFIKKIKNIIQKEKKE